MVTAGQNRLSTVITCHDDKGVIGIEHIVGHTPRTGCRALGVRQPQVDTAWSHQFSGLTVLQVTLR